MSANGEMLRLARQRRRLNQNEAAQLLSVKQPVLSRVENGLAVASDEMVERAQDVYGLPKGFFFMTDPVIGPPVSVHPPMWRKRADVSAGEMDSVVAELNIRAIHLRRLMRNVEIDISSNVPSLDIDEFESTELIAEKVRAHWGVPSGPIQNLTVLIERAGVLVAHSDLGGSSISGVTFRAPGVPPLIVLNSEQPADRMRYTLAHELGHIVMHRFPGADMEDQANQFASSLLMPEDEMRSIFEGRRVDLPLLAALKPEWKVSMQALLMRADSLGFISKNQSQYLWKQISFRRLRLREPAELDFPAEIPTVIPKILSVYQTAMDYSNSDIARLLFIHESDLNEMYGIGRHPPDFPRFLVLN